MSATEKEYVINEAVTAGQITICSVLFGRRSDFICKGGRVQNSDGLCCHTPISIAVTTTNNLSYIVVRFLLDINIILSPIRVINFLRSSQRVRAKLI